VFFKKHRYFCDDFQDYKLLCTVEREVAIGWFTQQYDRKCALLVNIS